MRKICPKCGNHLIFDQTKLAKVVRNPNFELYRVFPLCCSNQNCTYTEIYWEFHGETSLK
jgi:hypothetical protein